MSPRWYDQRTGDHLALDTGGGALARLWATALAGKVDTPFVKATGNSVLMTLPQTPNTPEQTLEWKVPQWSNAIERDRARIYFVAYSAAMAMHFLDRAMTEMRKGVQKVFEDFDVPEEGIGCGFHEAVRGVLSHHLVIRTGRSPTTTRTRRRRGTAARRTPTARRPYEDAVMGQPIFEENGQDSFRGIDIMRAVRSFDPCLPCGVTCTSAAARRSSRCTARCSARSTARVGLAGRGSTRPGREARGPPRGAREAPRPGRPRAGDRAGPGRGRALRCGPGADRRSSPSGRTPPSWPTRSPATS